jgi:hypothetical protein
MNVAHWLNAIDFETVFREHEIAAGALRDLVEADLEKISVSLGHRKRLLKAIAALGTGETFALDGDQDLTAVAGRDDAIGRDRGMGETNPLRRTAAFLMQERHG